MHKFLLNDEIKKSFKSKLNKEIEEIQKYGKNDAVDILYKELSEKIDNEGYLKELNIIKIT